MKIDKTYQESDGHATHVLGLISGAEPLKQKVVDVLNQVWMGDIIYHDDFDQYADALKEFGLDLGKELRSRGMDDPFGNKKDRIIKDRGDIGEVLGFIREIDVRGIPSTDLFAPILWAKLKGGLTTHGIDGIGFIWGSEGEAEQMILCEWKHTAQSSSIISPCSSASGAWIGLTDRKLLQELKRVMRIYEYRAEREKAQKVKWFLRGWLQRDTSVLCVTLIVYPDAIPIDQARQEVKSQLIQRCMADQTNPVGPSLHECNLLPLQDIEGFVDGCYQEFFNGG